MIEIHVKVQYVLIVLELVQLAASFGNIVTDGTMVSDNLLHYMFKILELITLLLMMFTTGFWIG